MLRSVAVLVSIVALMGFAGHAEASHFGNLHNDRNLSLSAGQDQDGAAVYAGHGSQCDGLHPSKHCGKSLPGTTMPDCLGGHKGPNGIIIQCK